MTANDKVFLITGASSGIGEATARAAAGAGYRTVLAARSMDKLEALSEELGGRDRALPVRCDVTEADDQAAMLRAALDAYGRIDVALANAGAGSSGDDGPDAWERMIRLNVFGAILTAKTVLPEIERNAGHVLLLGSAAGRRAIPGSVYGATKWAITGYGYNLREQLKGTGARVTLIEPGVVDTPFFDEPKPDGMKPEDVAAAILYAVGQPPRVNVDEIWLTPAGR